MLASTASLYKRSFEGLSKDTWLLSLVMMINRSGTMVIPFMTLYLTSREMGRSLSDAGLVMGLFGMGSVVGAWLGGYLSDRIGFFRVQLFALFSGGILFIVLGQLRSFPLICVFTFFLSLMNEAFRPANSTAISYYSKMGTLTRSFSLNRLSINFGWAVGTSVGGLLASISYELLFWVDGITNICAAVLLITFFREKHRQKKKPVKADSAEPILSPYKDYAYLWFIVLSILFAFAFFQLFTTIPKFFRDEMELSEKKIGFLMALNGLLIVAVEMVLIYKLEGRRNKLFYISTGVMLCALAFFSLLLPGKGMLIPLLMIILITAGEVLSMPFMNAYWTIRSNEKNRGMYAALYTIAWGIGQTIGPYICSLLVDRSGFPAMMITLGLVLTIAAFGFQTLKRAERPISAPEPAVDKA
jgi:predicted MFS family arabinose efflux permease